MPLLSTLKHPKEQRGLQKLAAQLSKRFELEKTYQCLTDPNAKEYYDDPEKKPMPESIKPLIELSSALPTERKRRELLSGNLEYMQLQLDRFSTAHGTNSQSVDHLMNVFPDLANNEILVERKKKEAEEEEERKKKEKKEEEKRKKKEDKEKKKKAKLQQKTQKKEGGSGGRHRSPSGHRASHGSGNASRHVH